ncbi:MAG TPA: tetratricopeptide repeat protein [Pyrinomonadaceae bacterium]|nr:tetratricopeptide repeat protein [Pyrinomonadaceae bacterium]
MIKFGITVLAMLAAMSAVAFGQQTPASAITADQRAAANDAYQKKDWVTAAERYASIVKAEDKNAGARYRLGSALLNLSRTKEAQSQLETAMSISANSVFGLALARAYAKAGDKEKMYGVFEQSLKLGGIAAESLNDEKDFASVKAEPKFVEYSKKLDAVANPCRAKPEFRQFDFWIGEWAPQNVQGVTVGTSSIQLILKDCVIFENWNTPVSSGKSFNVYDTRDGKWHQTWVDASGLITHYVGGLVGNDMVLTSESVLNGKKALAKMTFSKLPDGNVRQHGEGSSDDGKTWTTTFDFKYVKVK